jgi:hypothetical protein
MICGSNSLWLQHSTSCQYRRFYSLLNSCRQRVCSREPFPARCDYAVRRANTRAPVMSISHASTRMHPRHWQHLNVLTSGCWKNCGLVQYHNPKRPKVSKELYRPKIPRSQGVKLLARSPGLMFRTSKQLRSSQLLPAWCDHAVRRFYLSATVMCIS